MKSIWIQAIEIFYITWKKKSFKWPKAFMTAAKKIIPASAIKSEASITKL